MSEHHVGSVPIALRLDAETHAKLVEIAQASGLAKSKVAAALLAELVPTVKAVRPRLQVVREGDK